MPSTSSHDAVEPNSASSANLDRPVQVLSTTMRIHELSIESPAIIAYLRGIAADKQEIALIHAIEVGITEIMARRERLRH